MDRYENLGIVGLILVVTLFLAAVFGWVANIVAIANFAPPMTGMIFLRVIGVLFAPLGAVLGYF